MTTTTPSTKPTLTVDVAIIGAGTGGHNAYHQVTKATDSVIIINDGYWTTTCATVGCMPSKLLIAASERAYHANHSDEFGIIGGAEIDGKKVMQRVQSERDRFAGFLQHSVENWKDSHKIKDHATFNTDGFIVAGGEIIDAKHIIIATGSVPFIPDGWEQALGDTLLTSENVFEIPDLPDSVAVVGAGAMGLEFSQALSRLGVDVTLFNRSQNIGGIKDADVNACALECIPTLIKTEFNSIITNVERNNEGDNPQAVIHYTDAEGNEKIWQGQNVLVSTGRRNTLHKMGIENLGVKLDARNRPLDLDPLTGKADGTNVYIIGDANARAPLMHVASNEGYHSGKFIKNQLEADKDGFDTTGQGTAVTALDCVSNEMICDDDNNETDLDIKPYDGKPTTPMAVVFCEPQIAVVGQSRAQLEADNVNFVIGKVNFGNQGRSRVMGVNSGLLHIYADGHSGLILGASMVAPDGEYIAHILATAITNALTLDDLLASPFYHPTILEGLRTALRDARKQLK